MKIINLHAGPSAGKSTCAAGVFSLLKLHGVSAELSTEFAKDIVHKEAFKVLKDQLYLLGKQNHRQFIVKDKYKYLVTDSPILLSAIYGSQDKKFVEFVLDRYQKQDNVNFLLRRVKPYVQVGRTQTLDESMMIDTKVQLLMEKHNIPYNIIKGDYTGVNTIVKSILQLEGKKMEYQIATAL